VVDDGTVVSYDGGCEVNACLAVNDPDRGDRELARESSVIVLAVDELHRVCASVLPPDRLGTPPVPRQPRVVVESLEAVVKELVAVPSDDSERRT